MTALAGTMIFPSKILRAVRTRLARAIWPEASMLRSISIRPLGCSRFTNDESSEAARSCATLPGNRHAAAMHNAPVTACPLWQRFEFMK